MIVMGDGAVGSREVGFFGVVVWCGVWCCWCVGVGVGWGLGGVRY